MAGIHRRSPAYAGEVTGPLWDRVAPVISGVGSQSASRGQRRPRSTVGAPYPTVDATPGGNLLGHGTAIGRHSAARRCGPASLESAVSQFAALLWYRCFGQDVLPLA